MIRRGHRASTDAALDLLRASLDLVDLAGGDRRRPAAPTTIRAGLDLLRAAADQLEQHAAGQLDNEVPPAAPARPRPRPRP